MKFFQTEKFNWNISIYIVFVISWINCLLDYQYQSLKQPDPPLHFVGITLNCSNFSELFQYVIVQNIHISYFIFCILSKKKGDSRSETLAQEGKALFSKVLKTANIQNCDKKLTHCTIVIHRRRGANRNSMQNQGLSLHLVPIWSYTYETCCTRHEIGED